jgi:hypothetical protein
MWHVCMQLPPALSYSFRNAHVIAKRQLNDYRTDLDSSSLWVWALGCVGHFHVRRNIHVFANILSEKSK